MSDVQPSGRSRTRESWVGALSVGQESNWDICKEKELWGSGSNNAGGVKTGDDFFVWQSGSGWFARCVVTSDALHPTRSNPAPWNDGRIYKWIFGIKVIKELDPKFQPGSKDGSQNITGILNVQLGQFPKLSNIESQAVASFFGLVNPVHDPTMEILDQENDIHERALLLRPFLGELEKEQLVMARRGQGRYRTNLEHVEKSCRVTGLRDLKHLRASHIKPWRVSDDAEKLDGNNGLLLSPHVDHLFDRGWVQFENEGRLVASPKLNPVVLQSWRIEPDRNPQPFVPQQIEYLEYHREFIFQH